MRNRGWLATLLILVLTAPAAGASFTLFESGQVRPLALAADGSRLYAVNTPDDRLEIFDVGEAGLQHTASVPVGMEPVSVAVRSAGEVWVVNHLSDSVSVVDVASPTPRVVRTLLVGDEPRDIVFAGAGSGRAFITTAHRGQQRTSASLSGVPGAGDPQLTTAGVGRADVWVFDAAAPGTVLGGRPLAIVTLFGDTPRALAVSPDGGTVYAAVFQSGNQTTVISEGAVCNGFTSASTCVRQGQTMPGGLPGPSTNFAGENAPETGLIVRRDAGGVWRDPLGRNWSNAVRFTLPDEDVFAIDAGTLTQTAVYTGVGTTLFDMAVNPVTGALYVSNTEARNEVRFEGPGIFGSTTVQGHLAESRVTVVDAGGVAPRHLNKHIDYDELPAAPGVKEHSLATPAGLAVSPDGNTLYVAAFGSGKIGVFDTASLEDDSFDPEVDSADYLSVGGGPTAIVLDPNRPRGYVLTRFSNAVETVDLDSGDQVDRDQLHNPEPASVVAGRPFLYDANLTSSNGEASCSSCHIFGDNDQLAWDLGNPDDVVTANPIPINLAIAISSGVVVLPAPINGTGDIREFHPMKGPMTTQTLRGMDGSGAMHWRGDRSNPPGTPASAFDEVRSFNNFNVAFPGLVGREDELDPADMQRFTDFALQLTLPPNPVRALDNSLNAAQQRGFNFYFGPRLSDGTAGEFFGQQLGFTCEGCHRLDPAQKFFGTDGKASFENEQQIIKIPHLRNMYTKVGMFGVLDVAGVAALNQPHQGRQIRGFGFLHDGSVDTLFRFFKADVFSNTAIGGSGVGFRNDGDRTDIVSFMMAFPSNLAPVVGQQITLDSTNAAVVNPRLDLLEARAAVAECDVVVRGVIAGEQRGWVRLVGGTYQSDRVADAPVSSSALRALAATAGRALTYTCVPPGAGTRSGVDRDEDGFYDRDELDENTDPADAESFPGMLTYAGIPATTLTLKDDPTGLNPLKRKVKFKASTKRLPVRILPPSGGSENDPTLGGAVVTVYNAAGATNDVATVTLPAANWSALGKNTLVGWSYKDPDPNAAIRRMTVRTDKLDFSGGRALWPYTLDEAAQQRVAVRVQLGTGDGWCADAPADAKPSSDRPGTFKGLRHAAPPVGCPDLPDVASPSGAFLGVR